MKILLATVSAFVLNLAINILPIADLRGEKFLKFICSLFLGGAGNTREADYKFVRAFLKPLWEPLSFIA